MPRAHPPTSPITQRDSDSSMVSCPADYCLLCWGFRGSAQPLIYAGSARADGAADGAVSGVGSACCWVGALALPGLGQVRAEVE